MAYEIARLSDAKKVEHPYGEIYELFTSGAINSNFALVRFEDDRRHYHKKSTEMYYILSGTGSMELDDEKVDLEPNMLISIYPLTRHRATATQGEKLNILVISNPPYDTDDEFLDE